MDACEKTMLIAIVTSITTTTTIAIAVTTYRYCVSLMERRFREERDKTE